MRWGRTVHSARVLGLDWSGCVQPSENPPGRSASAGRADHRAETHHDRQAVCEARAARGCRASPHGTSALDVSHRCSSAQTSREEVCSWGQAAVSGVEA